MKMKLGRNFQYGFGHVTIFPTAYSVNYPVTGDQYTTVVFLKKRIESIV